MENSNTYQQNQNFNQPQNYGSGSSGIVNYKSATTAGLLGIFLGSFGVHDFYLGDKQKGMKHVILASVWLVADFLAGVVLPNALSWTMLYRIGWLLTILSIAGGVCAAITGIWGLVDGIKILMAGDAGLAQRGIPVAPQPNFGQGFNQNPNQNFNQNYNQNSDQNHNQPAPNQMPNQNPDSGSEQRSDNQEPANGSGETQE